jgi:hypothetical protein
VIARYRHRGSHSPDYASLGMEPVRSQVLNNEHHLTNAMVVLSVTGKLVALGSGITAVSVESMRDRAFFSRQYS